MARLSTKVRLAALFALALCWFAGPARAQVAGGFIENRGQWPEEVLYLARLPGQNVWVTREELVYDFYEVDQESEQDVALGPPRRHHGEAGRVEGRVRGHVLKLRFEGGSVHGVMPGPALTTRLNYFLGNDPARHASNVPVYEGVMLKGVYEGVGLQLGIDDGELALTFEANDFEPLSAVRLAALVGEELLDEPGTTMVETSLGRRVVGTIKWHVGAEWGAGTFQGGLLHLDRSRSMIEPHREAPRDVSTRGSALEYATFLGGNDGENCIGEGEGAALAVDGLGRAVIANFTCSPDYPATPGAYDTDLSGQSDAVVARLSADGSALEYATFIGGGQWEVANAVAIDGLGRAIVAGPTGSPDFPATPGAFDMSWNGGTESFVVRLSTDGSALDFSTFLGGSGSDEAHVLAIGGSGSVVIAGLSNSTNFPVTPGAYGTFLNGGTDAFVARLSADGSDLEYGTFLGGSGLDLALGLALDESGRMMVAGETFSSNFPVTPGAYDTSFNGYWNDVFVASLSADGSVLEYGTFLGGTGRPSEGREVTLAIDEAGRMVVAGYTYSPDFPVTPDAIDTTIDGDFDAYVTRFSADGSSLDYSTFLGGSGGDIAFSLAVDASNRAIVVGGASPGFPTTPGAYDTSMDGGGDAFVARLSVDGSALDYGTYIGGAQGETGYALSLDEAGRIVLGGSTSSSDFPVTPGAYDTELYGDADAFVARFILPDSAPPSTQPHLTLSAGEVELGDILTFNGEGFTANARVILVLRGPGGWGVDSYTNATSKGTYFNFFRADATTPLGIYTVFAVEELSGRYTPSYTYRVISGSDGSYPLTVIEPAPLEGAARGGTTPLCGYNGSGVRIKWRDKMLDKPWYIAFSAAERHYQYVIQRSYDGGITWVTADQEIGAAEYGSIVTFTKDVFVPSSGGVLFRVVDYDDTTRRAVSGECTVVSEVSEEATATFEWDHSYPEPDDPVFGVAADGVGRLFVRVSDRYPSQGPTLTSVTVTLSDPDGFTPDTRTLGRVKRAPTYAEISQYSTAANEGGSLAAQMAQPTAGTNGEFWFWYRAPEDFVRNGTGDGDLGSRRVTVTITATLSEGPPSTITRTILVVRPPLMLVHGLNGDPRTWDRFRRSDGPPFLSDDRFEVVEAPRLGGQDSYEGNAISLLGSSTDENAPSFAAVVHQLRERGYAVNQVDYVGHSMGGNVLRAAAARTSWLHQRNYGEGYVHKAITLDTPHNGSELADLLVDITPTVNQIPGAQYLASLGFYMGVQPNMEPTPAVRDLQHGANGVHFGVTPDIPTHFITGDYVPGDVGPDEVSAFEWLSLNAGLDYSFRTGFMLGVVPALLAHIGDPLERAEVLTISGNPFYTPTEKIVRLLNLLGGDYGTDDFGSNGDIIVSRSSQSAGLPDSDPHVTPYERLAHSGQVSSSNGVTEATLIGDRVDELLNGRVQNGLFRDGMPAYSEGTGGPPLSSSRKSLRTGSGRIAITVPAQGTSFAVGEPVTVAVSIPDTTGFSSLYLALGDAFVSSDVRSHAMSFELRPASVVDSLVVVALATFDYPDSTVVATDSRSVFAEPTAPPTDLRSGELVLRARVGDVVNPAFEAAFPTFIARLGSGSPGLTASVDDPGVVAFDPVAKAFTAIGEGTALAVVSYRGLADTLRFSVGARPQVSPVTVDVEPINGPIVIPATGGTFRFRATLTNTTAAPVTVRGWTEVVLPNGSPYGPVAGPAPLTLGPGQTRQLTLQQAVPASAPPGEYEYVAHVGQSYPVSDDSDAFSFTKLPAALAVRTDRNEVAEAQPARRQSGREVTTPGRRGGRDGRSVQERMVLGVPFVFVASEWPLVDVESGLPFGVEEAIEVARSVPTAAATAELPAVSALHPAAPNPFARLTRLRLDVAEPQVITVRVYDVVGREVARLMDGRVEAGWHEVVLDASRLPSGVYFVRAEGDRFRQAQRVTVVR